MRVIVADTRDLSHAVYEWVSHFPPKCVECGGKFPLDGHYTRPPALWRRLVRAFTDRFLGGGL